MPSDWNESFSDFHVHIFPEGLRTAIGKWFDKAGWSFPVQGTWREIGAYLEKVEGLERYVCFGYAHKPGIARELNRFYAEVPRFSPKAVPLAAVHQEDEAMAVLAHEALDLGCRGFKIHCQVQRVSAADPRFDPLYRVAAERGAFVLFHAGNGPYPGPETGYEKFRPLLTRHPDLIKIVAHLGAMESETFLRAAMDHETLHLDTSYTFRATPRCLMDAPVELLEAAHEKVLFATDFPNICHTYAEAIRAISELPLSEKARRAIFTENARRILENL